MLAASDPVRVVTRRWLSVLRRWARFVKRDGDGYSGKAWGSRAKGEYEGRPPEPPKKIGMRGSARFGDWAGGFPVPGSEQPKAWRVRRKR